MLRKGHGGRYKAPTKEERRKRAAKRIEILSQTSVSSGFQVTSLKCSLSNTFVNF